MASDSAKHNLDDPVLRAVLDSPVEPLLEVCGITNWDVVIIGDGSGSNADSPCGWSAVLVDRATRKRRLFGGHTNAGSVNFAESMPCIQAISWYDHYYGNARQLGTKGFFDVHIITDSQTAQQVGENAARKNQHSRPLAFLSAYLTQMQKYQYRFYWHWLARNQYALTELVDKQSKSHRITSKFGYQNQA